MAGANNAFLKSVGFRKREVATLRATWGNISSPKDARVAAEKAGIAVPAKLTARIAAVDAKRAMRDKAAAALAERMGRDAKLKMGDALGKRESTLAKQLSRKDIDMMARAVDELTAIRAGRPIRNPMTAAERARAGQLLENV